MSKILAFTTIIITLLSCLIPTTSKPQIGEKRAKIYDELPNNLSTPDFLVCTENIDAGKVVEALKPYMYFSNNIHIEKPEEYGLNVSYDKRYDFFISGHPGGNGIFLNKGVKIKRFASESKAEFAVLCSGNYNVTLLVDGNTINKKTVDLRALTLEGLRKEIEFVQEPQYVLPYDVAAQPDIYLPSTKTMTIKDKGTFSTKGAALVGFGLTNDDYQIQLPDADDRTEYGGTDENDIVPPNDDSDDPTDTPKSDNKISVVAIVISSVLGVLLIYIAYKLIRLAIKIFKGGD